MVLNVVGEETAADSGQSMVVRRAGLRKVLLITLIGRDFYLPDYLREHTDDLTVFAYQHSRTFLGGPPITSEHYLGGILRGRSALPTHFKSVILGLHRLNRAFLQMSVQVLIIWYVLKSRKHYDLCIASNTVDTIASFALKGLGAVGKVISVTQDHIDFPTAVGVSALSDTIFRHLDRLSQNHSDCVWYLSRGLLQTKLSYKFARNPRIPRIILSQPIDPTRAQRRSLNTAKRHLAVYAGRIDESSGLKLVMDALAGIVHSVPDARIKIFSVGSKEDVKQLLSHVRKLNLIGNIDFRGFVESRDRMLDEMAECAFGIAPQPPTRFMNKQPNAGKVKDYLSCGLPVLATEETSLSHEVAEAEAGLVVPYGLDELKRGLYVLMTDEERLALYSRNAAELAKGYDYTRVFEAVFAESIGRMKVRGHGE